MSNGMDRREWLVTAGLGTLALSLGAPTRSASAGFRVIERDYVLPPLPYAADALEPVLSRELIALHHGKHHTGYVKGLNATLTRLAEARQAGDFSAITALSRDLAFHGSGHVLHSLYWRSMTPGGSPLPKGRLAAAMDASFGSASACEAQFAAASKSVEGSGWGVLAYEPLAGRLVVLQAEKHQNLTIWGAAPIMVCDVWEHAYYVQYQNRRADYVDGFLKIVDWTAAAKRYDDLLA